eukprot:jgi/Bigna1/36358/e_gw1.14.26.1
MAQSAWSIVIDAAALVKASGLQLTGLLVLACFFSLSETAITTLWPWKIKEMALKEKGSGGALQSLRRNITRFLTTILIGGTLANIAIGALITEISTEAFGPFGTSVATAISTILIVLFCEITPKAIAVQHPQQILRAVVRPLNLIAIVLYPLGNLATILCTNILKLFGVTGPVAPTVTELELRMVLEGAEDSGQLKAEDADMVENVLELGDTTVEKVMTPLVDVVAVNQNATLNEMVEQWKKHQYSRFPVYSQRVDNLVGVVFTKDLLNFAEKPMSVLQKAKVRHIMVQPPFFVPESMIVRKLLQEFQTRKFHMAVVVNEYGGVAGVVTLEDVLEEIVGEIFDETDHPHPSESASIVMWGPGIWYAKGESSIDSVEETLKVKIPRGSSETIAGFVTARFGRIPMVGETFETHLQPLDDNFDEKHDEYAADSRGRPDFEIVKPSNKYIFKVVSTNERQVIEVRITCPDQASERASSSGVVAAAAKPILRLSSQEHKEEGATTDAVAATEKEFGGGVEKEEGCSQQEETAQTATTTKTTTTTTTTTTTPISTATTAGADLEAPRESPVDENEPSRNNSPDPQIESAAASVISSQVTNKSGPSR